MLFASSHSLDINGCPRSSEGDLFDLDGRSIGNPFDEVNGERLDDFAIAARLSYMLWNSVPDVRLLELAQQNKLSDPQVRREEAARMIADPKSRRAQRTMILTASGRPMT